MRADIANSKSILVIGGGPTGIESAGFMAEKYREKTIGICQRGSKLLTGYEGAHEKVLPIMAELNVKLHLN